MDKNQIKVNITAEQVSFEKAITKATDRITRMEEESRKRTTAMTSSFKTLGLAVTGAVSAAAVLFYANRVRQIADEYQNLNARLKLVTNDSNDLAVVQNRLFEISQDTGTSYAENAGSYAKLAVSLRDAGTQSDETLRITELVNKSLIINGSNTEEASSFMLQFAQAMGSGVLQGDEFRSMMENNSYFAQKLAKALGTDIAGLRKMSKDGKLTSDVLRAAFPGMAEEINAAFGQIPVTTSRAMTALQNAFYRIIDDSNKASDGTGTIATSILELAQTIDQNREGIISLFSSIIKLSSETIQALANIGQSTAGWAAVNEGRLSIFKFATMDAKELNTWLKENSTEISKLDGKLTFLKAKKKEIASEGYYTPEGIASKKAALAAINQEIAALEKQKEAVGQVATVSKTTSFSMSENATTSYAKITAAAKKSAAEQEAANKKALTEMKAKYQEYANEVKRLQADIAGREMSLTEQLREMNRSVMSDQSAWIDRKNEAEEYIAAAQKAAQASAQAFAAGDEAAGRTKGAEAVKLYDKAAEAAKDLNREVTAGDQVIASQQTNLKTAVALFKDAEQGAIAVQKNLEEAARTAGQALNVQSFGELAKEFPDSAKVLGEIKEQAELVNQEIEKLNGVYTNIYDEAKKSSADSAQAQKEDAGNVGKEIKLIAGVWTNVYDEAEKSSSEFRKQAIADISQVKSAAASIKLSTGSSDTVGFRTGGDPFYGALRGYGGGDRRLILVEDGEHIIRKEAVAALGGHGFFQRFNNLNFLRNLPRFAIGGPVTSSAGPAASPIVSGGDSYHFHFPASVSSASRQNARDQVTMFLSEMGRRYRGASRS